MRQESNPRMASGDPEIREDSRNHTGARGATGFDISPHKPRSMAPSAEEEALSALGISVLLF